jgi:hypothetical protein
MVRSSRDEAPRSLGVHPPPPALAADVVVFENDPAPANASQRRTAQAIAAEGFGFANRAWRGVDAFAGKRVHFIGLEA